jgi:hypothetical protein
MTNCAKFAVFKKVHGSETYHMEENGGSNFLKSFFAL